MIVGINTPSDTQAEQIKASKAIFTSYRVTVCEDITDFTPWIRRIAGFKLILI